MTQKKKKKKKKTLTSKRESHFFWFILFFFVVSRIAAADASHAVDDVERRFAVGRLDLDERAVGRRGLARGPLGELRANRGDGGPGRHVRAGHVAPVRRGVDRDRHNAHNGLVLAAGFFFFFFFLLASIGHNYLRAHWMGRSIAMEVQQTIFFFLQKVHRHARNVVLVGREGLCDVVRRGLGRAVPGGMFQKQGRFRFDFVQVCFGVRTTPSIDFFIISA
jgi:hypothetical protein